MLHEYLTIEHTAGQLATRDTTDTIGDIFIPYHVLYHYLRPGHQYVLPPGTLVRAVTQVTIDATNPHTIVFENATRRSKAPTTSRIPNSHRCRSTRPRPQRPHPLPKGKPTLPPTPTPTITPTPAPSDTPVASASPMPGTSSAALPSSSTSPVGPTALPK